MADEHMVRDHYEVLEVDADATPAQIRAAVTAQRRIWVRRQSSPDPARRTLAEQRVRDIDAAEKVLLDPVARAAYDERRRRTRTASGPRTPAGGPAAPAGHASGTQGAPRPPRPPGPPPPGPASRPSGSPPPSPHAPVARAQPDADVSAHLLRGEDYLAQGRWRLAQVEFEYALQRAPEDPRARAGLGAAHVGAGRVKDGLALLDQVAATHPDDARISTTVATALYEAAIAGLGAGPGGRGRPMITSRRQLALVQRHLRRIRRLRSTDPQVRMYADELAELVKEARRPVWTRSTNLRFYFVPFAGAAILTFLPSMEPLRALGVFWMVVIMAVYVLRHRQPSWKYHRRAAGRRPTRPPGGVFRRGI